MVGSGRDEGLAQMNEKEEEIHPHCSGGQKLV